MLCSCETFRIRTDINLVVHKLPIRAKASFRQKRKISSEFKHRKPSHIIPRLEQNSYRFNVGEWNHSRSKLDTLVSASAGEDA